MLDELNLNLMKAQQRMKSHEDQKRSEVSFNVGEGVYLKLQPYRQQLLARRPFKKLFARFYGPFKVVQRVGEVAYKLDLPTSCKLHPIFHISLLKREVRHDLPVAMIPGQLNSLPQSWSSMPRGRMPPC